MQRSNPVHLRPGAATARPNAQPRARRPARSPQLRLVVPDPTTRRLRHRPGALRVKRAIDVGGSAALLLLALPILILAAIAIRLDSRGPVFFRQTRVGQGGRPFEMWKLRSMVEGAESQIDGLLHHNEMDGPVFKIRSDPRITRVGSVLRRFSLDELPQLWNVLRGDMSLVGPRPPLPCEVAHYGLYERRRLSVKPGLTCEWQVSGRNEIGFEEWMRLDVAYADNWSIRGDLWLLLRTVPAVTRGTGA
jgi:lipopolysaccharide/colanic/teichoic acid biosynthesis glycosyltransferase